MNSATAAIILGALSITGFASAGSDPGAQLDQLDRRIPVPLLPRMALHQKQSMREHLESVQGIISGLSRNDFKAVAEAAVKIGFTPEMGRMCEHMGSGAAGFSEKAIHFHKTADRIVIAARKRDRAGVLTSLNDTLAQCTSCHATYRQQIVDQETLKLFTGRKQNHTTTETGATPHQ